MNGMSFKEFLNQGPISGRSRKPDERNRVVLSVYIRPDQARALHELSREECETKSTLIREAVDLLIRARAASPTREPNL